MMIPSKGRCKYIVFGEELAVVFPSFLDHDLVAMGMTRAIMKNDVADPKPTSAGYCYLNHKGEWVATGESVTLDLKSAENDSELINRWYEGI